MKKLFTLLAFAMIAVAASAQQSAVIYETTTYHNQEVNGESGLIISVHMDVNGMLGQTGTAVAYFFFDNGQKIIDYDNNYRAYDGQVSASTRFTPDYANAKFSDLRIFMPYSQLHLDESTNHSLYYTVQVFNAANQSLTEMSPVYFNVNYN